MRIALDAEWKLDRSRLWVCKTIDIDTGELRTWNEANSFREFIKDATLVVAHNGINSDFRVLMKLWNTKMTMPTYDTLVVSKLLKPNREGGHSLESWGQRLGRQKIDYPAAWVEAMGRKQTYDGECYDNPVMSLLDSYCERDVEVLRDLYLHLEKEWAASGFSQECFDLEHEVGEIIAQQEENGFKLDLPFATCLLADLKGKLAEIDDAMQQRWPPVTFERISDKTGKKLKDGVQTFNPGSRQQIAEKLKGLGWVPKKFTPTGQPVVDEDSLTEIIEAIK